MSTAQVQRTTNFGRGLYAGTNRFVQAPNSIPRSSNLIWLRRGALRSCDGTLIAASLNGAGPAANQDPIRFIGRYAPTGLGPFTYAFQVGQAGISLIDVSSGSYTAALQTYAVVTATPSFVQAQDYLALALGSQTPLQLLKGGVSTPISNSWTGAAQVTAWVASAPILQGSQVLPPTPNGHVYTALNNGMTGTAAPVFPTTPGATVLDSAGGGTVQWQESGPDTPTAPPGAAYVFFHGGFLFIWGTSPQYTADGINGPDCLAQSDLLNFNSWNPLNLTFVGQGDGTLPQGGGILTLGEQGIAATQQLILFKDNDTYVFNGFFPNWDLIKAPNGVGNAAPNSVQFLAGVGLMRLSYRGIALFDGQDDIVDEFTDPIRPYLWGDDEGGIIPVDWSNVNLASSAQLDNPRMYLLAVPLVGSGGQLTRIFGYDLTLKAWSVIDLPFGIASMGYIAKNPLTSRTLVGGAADGTIRLFGNGCNASWDGLPIQWTVRTPEFGLPDTPAYVRRLGFRAQPIVYPASVLSTEVVPAGFVSATLNYMDRNGALLSKKLRTPSKGLTGSMDVSVTLLSGNIDVFGQGACFIEGFGYQYTPKPPSFIPDATQIQIALQQVPNVIFQKSGSISVVANNSTVAILLPVAAPSANYQVVADPNWNSTLWVSNKSITGFTLNFNVPAPGDGSGSVDWVAQILV